MRTFPRLAGAAVALLFVLHAGAAVMVLLDGERRGASFPGRHELPLGVLAVGLSCLIGRVLLSWLPPGPLGSHAARHLPTTLAASFLLGLAGFVSLIAPLSFLFDVHSLWSPILTLALLVLLLAILRLATAPAAMVPGHPIPTEPAGPAARWIGLGLVVWAGALAWRGGLAEERFADGLTAGGWLAAWLLMVHGLRTARRWPLGSWLVVAFSSLAAVHLPRYDSAFLLAGASVGIAWLRRADRRALWLAALFLGFEALLGGTWPAAGGALGLVLAGHARQRPEAVRALGAVTLVVLLLELAHQSATGTRAPIPPPFAMPWALIWTALIAILVVALVLLRAGRTVPTLSSAVSAPMIAPPTAEARALLILLLAAILALGPWSSSWSSPAAVAELLPIAMLLLGLLILRPERPASLFPPPSTGAMIPPPVREVGT